MIENAKRKRDGRLKLSPRYNEKDWNDAFNGREAWDTAINIVEDRIKGRLLDHADRLLDEDHSGFAILALDCNVLESLWGFMNGKAVPMGGEQRVYRDMLMGFGFDKTQSDSFRCMVRNGIMHDAETRERWLVEKTYPSDAIIRKCKNGDVELNRTKFHEALKATFQDWLAKLRGGHAELRGSMRTRMTEIIDRHYNGR